MADIEGVGKETPIIADRQGGLSSQLPYSFDLLPAKAMFELAKVMNHGAVKYAINNWRLVDRHTHINHALTHIFAYMAGDRQDDHLEHALARIAMAVEVAEDTFPYNEVEKK